MDGRPAQTALLCLDGAEVEKTIALLEAAEHGIAALELRTVEDSGRNRTRAKR